MNVLNTFRSFAIIGPKQPTSPDVAQLDALLANRLPMDGLGAPEPLEYGWCGGRHLEDSEFTFQHNVFNDCLLFALRVDSNKVPGAIKKAYQMQEEQAAAKGNPSGFISKLQKAEAREAVSKRIEAELRTGKHRRSKLIPILWDCKAQMLYAPVSNSVLDLLSEIFARTFKLELQPLSAGRLAEQFSPAATVSLTPSRFVFGPGGESQFPDYPWVSKGLASADFLGNEFLLWLWYCASEAPSVLLSAIHIDGDATVMFDKHLDLDCAYGESGRDVLRGTGPTLMPEAREALQAGKLPRRAGLILSHQGSQYEFKLTAESMAISSLQLPQVQDAATPRALFEERITLFRQFTHDLNALYLSFLLERFIHTWPARVSQIRQWINEPKA